MKNLKLFIFILLVVYSQITLTMAPKPPMPNDYNLLSGQYYIDNYPDSQYPGLFDQAEITRLKSIITTLQSNLETLNKNYKALALLLHPDRHQSIQSEIFNKGTQNQISGSELTKNLFQAFGNAYERIKYALKNAPQPTPQPKPTPQPQAPKPQPAPKPAPQPAPTGSKAEKTLQNIIKKYKTSPDNINESDIHLFNTNYIELPHYIQRIYAEYTLIFKKINDDKKDQYSILINRIKRLLSIPKLTNQNDVQLRNEINQLNKYLIFYPVNLTVRTEIFNTIDQINTYLKKPTQQEQERIKQFLRGVITQYELQKNIYSSEIVSFNNEFSKIDTQSQDYAYYKKYFDLFTLIQKQNSSTYIQLMAQINSVLSAPETAQNVLWLKNVIPTLNLYLVFYKNTPAESKIANTINQINAHLNSQQPPPQQYYQQPPQQQTQPQPQAPKPQPQQKPQQSIKTTPTQSESELLDQIEKYVEKYFELIRSGERIHPDSISHLEEEKAHLEILVKRITDKSFSSKAQDIINSIDVLLKQ